MKRERKQLEDKVTNTVKGQFVQEIIDWSLQERTEGKVQLEFTINQERLGEIEEKLGIRFKNLKNPFHLALRPRYHWTDQKIKVHSFICVLGYLLAAIVWREARTKAQFKGPWIHY